MRGSPSTSNGCKHVEALEASTGGISTVLEKPKERLLRWVDELGLRTAWVLLLRGRDVKRGDTLVTAGPSELDALIILADGRFTAVFVQMRSPVAYSPSKSFFCVT